MDVYKIGIALSMSSNHNAILSALSSHLLHAHANVNNLTSGFSRLKVAIAGALSATAGIGILHTMAKLVDKTKEFSDELVKLENMGAAMRADVLSGDITKRAFDISQRVPMKVTDLMKIPGATYSILGQKEAMETWEDLAKLSFVLQSQKDYKGDPGKDLQQLIRAGEMTGRFTDAEGHIDIPRLKKFLDMSTRIISATHGMVNPQTMLGMAQQGGFTERGLSDEGFYSQAIMAQAMGGPRSGTALLSLWQQMAGGTMLTRSAQGLQDIGLLKPGEWETGKGGHVILGEDASKRLTKLIGKDPLDFAAKLVENLKERGITDQEEQMRKVMRALGRQTTQRYSAEMVNNFHQMLAERERMMSGMGAEGSFDTIMGKSVGGNIEGMKNAWGNLLMAVAGPNSEQTIKVLQSITGMLNSMQRSVTGTDPETIMSIAKGVGALGVALSVGGAVAILAAIGPAGWLIGGLAALAVALSDERFRKWLQSSSIADAVTGWFTANLLNPSKSWLASNSIAEAVSGWFNFNVLEPIRKWLSSTSISDAIVGALKNFFSGGSKGGDKTDPANKGLLQLNRFDPGTSKIKAAPISLSLNVDGRTLAQSISEQLEYLYEHATGAPSHDGYRRFAPADGGMMGT